ncbi:glycosyltransferase family 4 protein [Microbacterium sp. SSW1-49]|uniref:Glycosyltransferase family 4 protein n=1 Tax=Microbacterium croceum TaxID=2851645 RepID=A0ABT0FCW8_9MICO|nr:glycosyltransferase family 4 protein [Microbacterium croceum]MCK2035916.1 glycosyltransferase family 4 protein [Microbacterium croceum]
MMMRAEGTERTVAVFAPLYPPAFMGGGPIRSIAALVAGAPEEVHAVVLTKDTDLGAKVPMEVVRNSWSRSDGADVYYASMRSPFDYWRALIALRRTKPALLHFNSFLNPQLTIFPLILWRLGFWGRARVLLSPRGEFGEGALQRRSAKKRIYMRFFRVLRMPKAVIWHSTAAHETSDLRRIWGDSSVVLERENDTLLAEVSSRPRSVDGPLRAVFLGRIVEHKGLHIALEALAHVAGSVRLDVYGSREDSTYGVRCDELVSQLPPHVSVEFHGPIRPDLVVDVLKEHELLLMPTAGENFGHVIAEALSASCAVAVTPFTPWTEDLSTGGGFVLDRDVASWTTFIDQFAAEPPAARMSHRIAAGAAYDRWRGRSRPPHLWTSAFERIEASE